jgi:hypothetical protein
MEPGNKIYPPGCWKIPSKWWFFHSYKKGKASTNGGNSPASHDDTGGSPRFLPSETPKKPGSSKKLQLKC